MVMSRGAACAALGCALSVRVLDCETARTLRPGQDFHPSDRSPATATILLP